MEVVTVSIYVIPEASSCAMQLAHTIATEGLIIASGCVGSRGTSKVVTGNGSPYRQAIISSKFRCRATTCIGFGDSGEGESHSACLTCKCSSALWHQALLASELQWWCLCFDSPKAGEACPAAVTGWEGCSTFSQLANWFGGASIFAHSSCSTWDVVTSLRDPPMGAASSMVTSSVGTSVKVGRTSLEMVNSVLFPENPSGRATPSKTISLEKETYCSIVSHNSRIDFAKRHG